MCNLKVRFSQSPDKRGVFGFALKVEVISASGISPKIFVYHQSPEGINGNFIAEFMNIASPVDLQEYPEDAATTTIPWYRTDKCTIWVRSISDLEMAKQLFIDDIAALRNSVDVLNSENNFTNQSTIEFSDSGVNTCSE